VDQAYFHRLGGSSSWTEKSQMAGQASFRVVIQ
jgi:hypothetical protein